MLVVVILIWIVVVVVVVVILRVVVVEGTMMVENKSGYSLSIKNMIEIFFTLRVFFFYLILSFKLFTAYSANAWNMLIKRWKEMKERKKKTKSKRRKNKRREEKRKREIVFMNERNKFLCEMRK